MRLTQFQKFWCKLFVKPPSVQCDCFLCKYFMKNNSYVNSLGCTNLHRCLSIMNAHNCMSRKFTKRNVLEQTVSYVTWLHQQLCTSFRVCRENLRTCKSYSPAKANSVLFYLPHLGYATRIRSSSLVSSSFNLSMVSGGLRIVE